MMTSSGFFFDIADKPILIWRQYAPSGTFGYPFRKQSLFHGFTGWGCKRSKRYVVMPQGTVKWFNDSKGFGFIQSDDGADVSVHQSEIQMDGYRTLPEGARVQFEVTNGEKGPKASRVKLAD